MLSTSTHVFSEIFIHLNWHCKNDISYLTPEVEKASYGHIANFCHKTKGIKFCGIGGTENHIHLVIQMEPDICLAQWIGQLKGGSSHDVNQMLGKDRLHWQRGYGAVSFALRDLPAVLKYVSMQKEHHQCGSINDKIERHGTYMEDEYDEASSAAAMNAL